MDYIDPAAITLKVINGIYSGVTTVELDNLAAETAATMTTRHPGQLASSVGGLSVCGYWSPYAVSGISLQTSLFILP